MNNSIDNQKQRFQALISGVGKHFTSSLTLGKASLAPADITKVFQALVDALDALLAEKAKLASVREAVGPARTAANALAKLLVSFVRATFGNDPEVLADFGLKPLTVRKKSPSVLVQAAKKAKATRAVRHTMGPVQKKAISEVLPPKA